MPDLRVLVVGASIAGPTAAYWFARAGAQVTVIERFPSLRPGGQNLDVRNVGVTVMRRMADMEETVKARLAPIDGFALCRKDGPPFAKVLGSGDAEQQSFVSEYEIFRGDLSQILYDLTKNDERVKYVFSEQIAATHYRHGDDGPVQVEFMNGYPSAEYDLVVACDGSTSRTRAMALGCGVRDHMHPMNAWHAWATIDKNLLEERRMGEAFNVPGGKIMIVVPSHEGHTNSIMLMAVLPKNNPDATLPFREASKKGPDELKKFVCQHYRGIGWKSDEVLAGVAASTDFYAAELAQVKAPRLSQGRVVLVGDAGYAAGPIGTGTSLAMAGAYVLAGEIAKHCRAGGSIAAGLHAYEQRMRPIVDDLQRIPPGIPAILAPQAAWTLWLRDTAFYLGTRAALYGKYFSWMTGIIGWLSGFWSAAFASDGYELPNYEEVFEKTQ